MVIQARDGVSKRPSKTGQGWPQGKGYPQTFFFYYPIRIIGYSFYATYNGTSPRPIRVVSGPAPSFFDEIDVVGEVRKEGLRDPMGLLLPNELYLEGGCNSAQMK
ncbi:hypothetical protein H5410_031438 [Solanum commersonii]|uniref:Uncharacterized protein n=1 Tax=Solanum commersonii TaxID=4109 RepID=A0A9J5YLP8_SOLCO|nr:hypothetical protein H5410_031438 [Solanum commersonii]